MNAQIDSTLPRVQRFHRLSTGRIVSAGQVVRALRIVHSQPLSTYYPETFTCGGFGGDGRDVLRAFSGYCAAEIMRRGGVTLPDMDTPERQARLRRRLCARARPSECRWCGQSLARYVPDSNARFCEASCRRSYYQ